MRTLLPLALFLAAGPLLAQDTFDPAPVIAIPERAFIYSVGTNFDFIEKLTSEKLYHDIRVSLPSIGKKKDGSTSRWGLEFSFDRFRTVSQVDSGETIYRDIDPLFTFTETDTTITLQYVTTTAKSRSTTFFDNIGVALAPLYTISDPADTDWWLALTGDVRWQRSVFNRNITRTFSDTASATPPEEWPRPYEFNARIPEEKETFKSTTDNFYIGGGFRGTIKKNGGLLNFRAVIGHSTSLLFMDQDSKLVVRQAPYYAVNVELIEAKVSGIKLGMELRGFIGIDKTDILRNQARFNLFLAKEIKWNKIGELLKAS